MESKKYTAQELRDMAENITRVDVMDGLTCREHCYPVEQEVKSMLRYAANAVAEENKIPIVDLNEIKPVQFNKTQVYDELNRINNRGAINPVTVIKMLKQLHYIMTETIPPRNCDRPECATTKAAQEVWRKEDGGKTAYYEWLLATSTKGEAK